MRLVGSEPSAVFLSCGHVVDVSLGHAATGKHPQGNALEIPTRFFGYIRRFLNIKNRCESAMKGVFLCEG